METPISSLKNLLSATEKWQAGYRETHCSSTEKVNIFRILEVSHKEVVMCRMLADLMGNANRHVNAKRHLDLFLVNVLKLNDLPTDFTAHAYVDKEYLIPGTDRRIDLAIYTMDYFIPIEVKIYAEDQESQCYDYYQYAKSLNKTESRETILYYLTLDGKEPSMESISKTGDHQKMERLEENVYKTISWKQDIVQWLRMILDEMDTGEEKEVTEQFLEVIEEMTGLVEQEKKNEVVDLLTNGEEEFRAALTIGNYIASAKSKNAENFMRDMEIAMKPVV